MEFGGTIARRWARKHGVERMPKCPDVPWVGMTEKRKYGKVPVLMGPKKNPPATNLEWEHRTGGPKGQQTLFGRDESGGGVAVRFNVRDGERELNPLAFETK